MARKNPLFVDATDAFAKGKKTFEVSKGFTILLRDKNTQKGDPLGTFETTGKRVAILHHTAGDHDLVYNDYHWSYAYDEATGEAVLVKCLKTSQKGMHLFSRNSGAFGHSLCGAAGASLSNGHYNPGRDPIQRAQVNLAGQALGEQAAIWGINPAETLTVPERKWDGGKYNPKTGRTIQAPTLTSHGFYGKRDGYGSWDPEPWTAEIVRIAREVYTDLKQGRRKFELMDVLKAEG